MSATCFCEVRDHVLAQHVEIRARIDGLNTIAERSDLWALRVLRILLLRFASHFDEHLGFEERELLPRIREIDAWGKVREDAMLSEHRDQRRRLEEASALAEEPDSFETGALSDAVYALTAELLREMLVEEATLHELACIEEHGHADQMTG